MKAQTTLETARSQQIPPIIPAASNPLAPPGPNRSHGATKAARLDPKAKPDNSAHSAPICSGDPKRPWHSLGVTAD